MAIPLVVQSALSASLSAATTTLTATWGSATTIGNRLLLLIAVNDDGTSTTLSGADLAGWTLMNPPGKITRQNAGVDVDSVWVYQKLNAASESGAKSVTLNTAKYGKMALVEVSGSSTITSSDARQSNTGAAQTLSTGTMGATTIAECLLVALYGYANIDAASNPLPAGWSILGQVHDQTVANTHKNSFVICTRGVSATGAYDGTIDVAGGFNHNYAAIIAALPATGGGASGPPALPNTDDGKGHFACSLHYQSPVGAIDTLAHAQALADKCDIVNGFAYLSSYPGSGNLNNFGTYADDILARKPGVLMICYGKTAETVANGSYYPAGYYSYTCAGAKLTTFASNIYATQPDGTGSYTDAGPNGFTSQSWREWRARDGNRIVTTFNAVYASCLKGFYLDSAGTASYKGTNCNPATHVPYTQTEWVNLVRTVGDEALTRYPNQWIWANGLGAGSNYFTGNPATGGLLDHCHGAVAESWIRNNYSAATAFPDATKFENCVNMIIDANVTRNKSIWLVVNIGNDTAGNPPTGWTDFTDAQVDQWKRYTYCTYMLGNRGKAYFEFVRKVTERPWDETHTYYSQDLGAPLESLSSAAAMKVGAVYRRKYTNGVILASPAGGTITADRDYQDPITNAIYPNASVITLAANTGLLLKTAGSTGTNTAAPVVSITSPPAVIDTPATPVVATATCTDADGIATVTMSIDGGAQITPTLVAGAYTHDFAIWPNGAHTLVVTATDAHPTTPRTTTQSLVFTVADPRPLVTVAASITGYTDAPIVGQALSLDPGSAAGTPSPTASYEWFWEGGATPIATTPTYTPATADTAHRLRGRVTWTNQSGVAHSDPPLTPPVVAAPVTPGAPGAGSPMIVGYAVAPRINQPLTLTYGTWTGSPPPVLTQQWNRDGVAITGATQTSYTPIALDLNHALTVTVTGVNASGQAAATSAATPPVVAATVDLGDGTTTILVSSDVDDIEIRIHNRSLG